MTEESSADAADDLDTFLRALLNPPFNGHAGNKSLRESLGWAEETERYWQAHGRALDQGRVQSGRGKGGSVQAVELLSEPTEVEGDISQDTTKKPEPREVDLYEPARKVISDSWVKAENYDEYVVSITGLRGRASTGGKWTRPDISLLAIKAYPYLPHRYFDIVTFEVKPAGQTSVEGIFEALSHQQFGTRAYTLFNVPDLAPGESFQDKYPDAMRILSTARKHGVGVIVASDIFDWEAWDELLTAERVTPDPEQANRFIATGFPDDIRDQIIKWHK